MPALGLSTSNIFTLYLNWYCAASLCRRGKHLPDGDASRHAVQQKLLPQVEGFSSCTYRSIDALKIAKTISTFNLGIFVPFLSKSIHLLSIFIIPSIYLFISITFEYSKYLFITIYYLSRPLSNIPNIYLSYLGILIRIMESRDEKREKKKNVFRVVLRGNDSVGN